MNFRSGVDSPSKEISFGDTVVLRDIDSPEMLVTWVGKEDKKGKIRAIWFDKNNAPQGEFFHTDLIKVIPKKEEKPKKLEDKVFGGISLNSIIEMDKDQFNDTLDNILQNRKIQAIKTVRAMSGTGLKEAKDFVEGVMEAFPKKSDLCLKWGQPLNYYEKFELPF